MPPVEGRPDSRREPSVETPKASQWKRALGRYPLPLLVKWGVRQGYRLLTSRARSLPDFIIIGAQRCGTTSLYNYLIKHRAVLPAFIKETHFFDQRFEKGLNWYRANFPLARAKEGTDRAQVLAGESTPYYLYYPHAPRRVWEAVPGAKLIVLLRNPVDRAFSHYHHEVRTGALEAVAAGAQEIGGFERALEREQEILPWELAKVLEDERYQSFGHIHYSFLSRGIYVDQLLRWNQYFDREQMLILRSEGFYGDTAAAMERVHGFLGLPSVAALDRETVRQRSAPQGEYKKYNLAHYEPMKESTRQRLQAFYEPHNRRLYEYVGEDFGWEGG